MRPMRVGGTAPSALLPLTLPQLPATTCGTHFSRDCHAAFAKVPPLLPLAQQVRSHFVSSTCGPSLTHSAATPLPWRFGKAAAIKVQRILLRLF